jgi:SagB-type dehydrogenase family enzyme
VAERSAACVAERSAACVAERSGGAPLPTSKYGGDIGDGGAVSGFRDAYPAAWQFHAATSRWPHNAMADAGTDVNPEPAKEYLSAPAVALPPGDLPAVDLRAVVGRRLSCRRFADEPLSGAEVGALLRAAYGVGPSVPLGELELNERPVPSAGGLYPLELYLLLHRADGASGLTPGIYHYAALGHVLERLSDVPVPGRFIAQLFLGQPYAADAAAVVVLTSVLNRSLKKYEDRGYRYVLFEAGHVAQNLNLAAAALGLGSCNLGGFFDQDLAEVLGLDVDEEVPLYCVAVGRPAEHDRATARMPPG